jgi:hypothetical protein
MGMIYSFFFCTLLSFVSPAGADTKLNHPYLYRIEKQGHISYVFGTIHVGFHLSDLPFDMPALIKRSRTVLPEIDIPMSELELWEKNAPRYLEWAAQQKPRPKAPLSASVKAWLKDYGFSDSAIAQISENNCAVVILPFEFAAGNFPLDTQILKLAHESAPTVLPLDDDKLRDDADKNSNCHLEDYARQSSAADFRNEIASGMEEDKSNYLAGEDPQDEDDPGTDLRNQKWIDKIDGAAIHGGALVVVGYGHLFGPYSVLKLLQERGYSVTRVTRPDE